MTPAERINAILDFADINAKKFSEILGLKTPQLIYDVTNGKTKNITDKFATKILLHFDYINRAWLLTGEGKMINEETSNINKVEIGTNSFLIPCLPLRAEAGSLAGFTQSVMPYDCYVVASPVKDAEFAVDIHGDSMEPEYPSGCRVFVQKITNEQVKVGYTYILDTASGLLLKEIIQVNENNLTYHSLNPKYADELLAFSDVNGIYKVLGCLTFK